MEWVVRDKTRGDKREGDIHSYLQSAREVFPVYFAIIVNILKRKTEIVRQVQTTLYKSS